MRGIDARRQVIAPDAVAGFAWYSKRLARPAYLAIVVGNEEGYNGRFRLGFILCIVLFCLSNWPS